MDLITDDGDNTSQQDNLTGVTYEFIITTQVIYNNELVQYKRDRSLWQSWWTCLNYASKLSIAYATKVKVSCTFQTKANWFFLVREQLTKTPWWYLPISLSSTTIGYMGTFSWSMYTTAGHMDTPKKVVLNHRHYVTEWKISYTIMPWRKHYTW